MAAYDLQAPTSIAALAVDNSSGAKNTALFLEQEQQRKANQQLAASREQQIALQQQKLGLDQQKFIFDQGAGQRELDLEMKKDGLIFDQGIERNRQKASIFDEISGGILSQNEKNFRFDPENLEKYNKLTEGMNPESKAMHLDAMRKEFASNPAASIDPRELEQQLYKGFRDRGYSTEDVQENVEGYLTKAYGKDADPAIQKALIDNVGNGLSDDAIFKSLSGTTGGKNSAGYKQFTQANAIANKNFQSDYIKESWARNGSRSMFSFNIGDEDLYTDSMNKYFTLAAAEGVPQVYAAQALDAAITNGTTKFDLANVKSGNQDFKDLLAIGNTIQQQDQKGSGGNSLSQQNPEYLNNLITGLRTSKQEQLSSILGMGRKRLSKDDRYSALSAKDGLAKYGFTVPDKPTATAATTINTTAKDNKVFDNKDPDDVDFSTQTLDASGNLVNLEGADAEGASFLAGTESNTGGKPNNRIFEDTAVKTEPFSANRASQNLKQAGDFLGLTDIKNRRDDFYRKQSEKHQEKLRNTPAPIGEQLLFAQEQMEREQQDRASQFLLDQEKIPLPRMPPAVPMIFRGPNPDAPQSAGALQMDTLLQRGNTPGQQQGIMPQPNPVAQSQGQIMPVPVQPQQQVAPASPVEPNQQQQLTSKEQYEKNIEDNIGKTPVAQMDAGDLQLEMEIIMAKLPTLPPEQQAVFGQRLAELDAARRGK